MNVMIVRDFFAVVERLQSHHNQTLSFSCRIVSHDGNPVISASGNVINMDAAVDEIETVDLIIIPPIEGKQLGQNVKGQRKIVQWLQQRNNSNIPIVSVSTGAFLLAEAEFLSHKLVATHWAFIKYFRKKYPTTHFISNKSYTLSDNIYSTGTFTGCMDVLLHYIATTKGEHFAQQCAAHGLLTSPELLTPVLLGKRNHPDEAIIKVQDWIEENFNKHFSILDLATKFAYSERNLKRRFKLATGISPIKYLQNVRIEKAKRLLIATDRSVSDISYTIGYENCSFFIRLFKRTLGVTPKQWRLQ
jgi:transcriptional regulator GlxA family with amidase domain